MARILNLLKRKPLLTAALALAVVLAALNFPQESTWDRAVLRIFLTGTMSFLLYLISGEKTLFGDGGKTGWVIRRLSGILVFGLVVGASAAGALIATSGIAPGLPSRLISLMVLFLFVGFFEELCFRAILNDALVYRFRDRRWVFVLSAVASSLIFGAMHVIGSSVTSPEGFAQALLKTLSTGIAGFAFLILYWKTRNIWAVGLAHGLFDFLSALPLVAGSTTPLGAGTYVQEGIEGLAAILVYVIEIVVTGLITLSVWRKVGRTIDFEEMRKNW